MQDFAIRAEGLSKRYRLGVASAEHDSLRDLIVGGVNALIGRNRSKATESEFFALRDASFEIARGENVGIIGANGAGKSTLLKILSRIVEPTSGRALVRGRVGALLEVGTGFHQELTGRENIFLYGAILGMNHREITAKFDAIVDFAEIEQFIDTPVKRYSSGMYVRLAFAVAAHLRPDILLLDEVLAVGDIAFQRKCMNFARELQQQEATILFVSHNMFSIKAMCSRVILIKGGRIAYDGPTDVGIAKYEEAANLTVVPWLKGHPENWPIILTKMELHAADGELKSVFDRGERISVQMTVNVREDLENLNVMVAFVRSDGVGCTVYTSETDDVDVSLGRGESTIEVRTPPLKLTADRYIIHVLFRKRSNQELLGAQVGSAFHVRDEVLDSFSYGVYHEGAQWRVSNVAPATQGQATVAINAR